MNKLTWQEWATLAAIPILGGVVVVVGCFLFLLLMGEV